MRAPGHRPDQADSFRRRLEYARAGSAQALGQLLDGCRHYLLVAAARGFDPVLNPKAGPSDVVQQTFLEAQRDFERFTGDSEAELIAWLNCILVNNLRNLKRGYATAKRRYTRERPVTGGGAFDRPSLQPSPSGEAMAREEEVLRTELVRRLEPYRQRLPDELRAVLDLYLRVGPDFRAIAAELGCVEKTARRRFGRAVLQLRDEFGRPPT